MKNSIIPYNKDLVERARYLRKNSSPGEIELWLGLKKKQILGYDFDRQKPIDNFIVDFYCKELKLAIEVDGNSHDYKIGYDIERQKTIESYGIKVLRYSEEDARDYTQGVVDDIKEWVLKNT